MEKSYQLLCLIFITGTLLLSPTGSNAQWQADVRLTNEPAYSWTTDNNAWCIASSDKVVHVVWFDLRDNGNSEIYYRRSADAGETWGEEIRLTNNSDMSRFPSVAVSGSVVHVVWEDNRDGNPEIYYKRSTDAGITWEADVRLTNNSAISAEASVAVSGSNVHVVWTDDRDGDYEIYYKSSTDGGLTWGADTRLTNHTAYSRMPSVAVSGSLVHVVWADRLDRESYDEVYYKCSTDGGITWGTDTRLTNNSDYFSSWLASVSASGPVVHVVFTGNRDGDTEIYYKRSTDSGLNWSAVIRLTNNTGFSESPSVIASVQAVHIVWADSRDGNYEIYYKRSTDGGVNWGSDTRLTDGSDQSVNSSVTVSGSVVHVVWKDLRDGNWEIYYKRDPTGNINGITNINSQIQKEFSILQNYPNPFNKSTVIHWESPVGCWQTLKVYDIYGKEIFKLVDEYRPAGEQQAEFSGISYPDGIYFYQLKAGNFVQTRQMILIK